MVKMMQGDRTEFEFANEIRKAIKNQLNVFQTEFAKKSPDSNKVRDAITMVNATYDILKSRQLTFIETKALQELYNTIFDFKSFLKTSIQGKKMQQLISEYTKNNDIAHERTMQNIKEIFLFTGLLEGVRTTNGHIYVYDAQEIKDFLALQDITDSFKQTLLGLQLFCTKEFNKESLPFTSYANLHGIRLKYKGKDIPVYQLILKAGLNGNKSKEDVILDAIKDFNEHIVEDDSQEFSNQYAELLNFAIQNKVLLTLDQINFRVLSDAKTIEKLFSNLLQIATKQGNEKEFMTKFIYKLAEIKNTKFLPENSTKSQAVVDFMSQAIKQGVMNRDYLESALGQEVIGIEEIKQFATQGLLTKDMLNIELGYEGNSVPLYEVMIREKVDVSTGKGKPIHIGEWFDKQFPGYLQTDEAGKQKAGLKFRDLEVESYTAQNRSTQDSTELINTLLHDLELDIKDKRKGDTVLNHLKLQRGGNIVYKPVMEQIAEQGFKQISEHLEVEALKALINLNPEIGNLTDPVVAIGKEGKHPFLVAHDNAVVKMCTTEGLMQNIKDAKVNEKGQPVAEGVKDGMTLLEYTSKHKSQAKNFQTLLESDVFTAKEIAGMDIPIYQFIFKAGLNGNKSKEDVILDAIKDFNEHIVEDDSQEFSNQYAELLNFAIQNKVLLTLDQINFRVLSDAKTIEKLLSNLLQTATKQGNEKEFMTKFIDKLAELHDAKLLPKDHAKSQAVVDFMSQAIKKGLMNSDDLESALGQEVIGIEEIKQFATQGLLTKDMLNIELRYEGNSVPLYKVMIREKVDVSTGKGKPIHIGEWFDKQFPGYLQTDEAGKQKTGLKFRDLEVESYTAQNRSTQDSTELINTLLHDLELDIKDKRKGDTVLNHLKLQRGGNIVYKPVMEQIAEQGFKQISEHLEVEALKALINLNPEIGNLTDPVVAIGKEGKHPFLVAHDNAVVKMCTTEGLMQNIKDAKVNEKGQPVAENGMTLLEYTSKHKSQAKNFQTLLESDVFTAKEIAGMDIPVKRLTSVVDELSYPKIEEILLEKVGVVMENNDFLGMLQTATKQGNEKEFMTKFRDKLIELHDAKLLPKDHAKFQAVVDFMSQAIKQGAMTAFDIEKMFEANIIGIEEIKQFATQGLLTKDMLNIELGYEGNSVPLYKVMIREKVDVSTGKGKPIHIGEWFDKQFPGYLQTDEAGKQNTGLKFRDLEVESYTAQLKNTKDERNSLINMLLHDLELDIKDKRKGDTVLNHLKFEQEGNDNIAYQWLMEQITEKGFKQISEHLEVEALKALINLNPEIGDLTDPVVAIGKEGKHPFLVAHDNAVVKMCTTEGLMQNIKDAKVNEKGQPVAENGMTLLEYTSKHKSQAKNFQTLLESDVFTAKEIAGMDIPIKKIASISASGSFLKTQELKTQELKIIERILIEKIKSEKNIPETMADILHEIDRYKKTNPDLSRHLDAMYDKCAEEIGKQIGLTEEKNKTPLRKLFEKIAHCSSFEMREIQKKSDAEFTKGTEVGDGSFALDRAKFTLAYYCVHSAEDVMENIRAVRFAKVKEKGMEGSFFQRYVIDSICKLAAYLHINGSKDKEINEKITNVEGSLEEIDSGADSVKNTAEKKKQEMQEQANKGASK